AKEKVKRIERNAAADSESMGNGKSARGRANSTPIGTVNRTNSRNDPIVVASFLRFVRTGPKYWRVFSRKTSKESPTHRPPGKPRNGQRRGGGGRSGSGCEASSVTFRKTSSREASRPVRAAFRSASRTPVATTFP